MLAPTIVDSAKLTRSRERQRRHLRCGPSEEVTEEAGLTHPKGLTSGLRSLWNYSDSDVEDGEEDDEMEAMLGGLDSLPSNPDMLLQQDASDGSGSESGSAGGSEGGMSDDEQ